MQRYQEEAPGDWGHAQNTPTITTATEELATPDSCKLFLRSWKTNGPIVLLILHGLGGQSGWYIDMGNELASRGLSVYAVDHRGFGRSGGLRGHINAHRVYVEDITFVIAEIQKRHLEAKIYVLGHSMGGIFAAHLAAEQSKLLAGVLFLNPWIQDSAQVPFSMVIGVLFGGLFKSKHSWRLAGGTEGMTTNPEAIQLLQADPYWQRSQTSSFLFQILLMRSAVLKKAKQITIPALVLQAEADKSVLAEASHKFYETLASSDKTWKTYPDYGHDSQFEPDRSQMDNDIVAWIEAH